ncbi:DoxX family protein [Streptomyces sp. SKN60]|uniref:DoxX family protein n=1 Tax=Streptomyces sp. SKN60 TaxID=2855506 RepID=UPI002246CEF1|nr:DoxX family protein [Streptomyces sp. SKN60]MCX2184787.1 DoxX family protein [Streptomyces sp. SKN60]
MNIALWIVTGLLATAYFLGGGYKLITPKEKILAGGPNWAWAEGFPPVGIKGIGALEVLGALGLVLPAVLDIAPGLVPVAATGLALIMAGAAALRLRRREFAMTGLDLFFLALFVFVAWGRY